MTMDRGTPSVPARWEEDYVGSRQQSSMQSAVRDMAGSLVALAAFVVLAQANAAACRCPVHVSASTFYRKAQFVVTGKVVEVHANANGDGWTATVAVDRAWKAEVPKTISISTHTTCAFEFTRGAEYLLYLFRDPAGGFYTSKCVGNLPVAEAGARLRWLERNGTPASTAGS